MNKQEREARRREQEELLAYRLKASLILMIFVGGGLLAATTDSETVKFWSVLASLSMVPIGAVALGHGSRNRIH